MMGLGWNYSHLSHTSVRETGMASAEMSSSEILRQSSQGSAGEPTNYEPEATEPQVSLVEADESVWKKYSSHYEFPLSVLVALGIHILALLVVVAVMTISFYFGKPPAPIVEGHVVIKDGVGPDPNRQAGGSQRQGDPNSIQLPTPKLDDLPQPPDPTNPNVVASDPFEKAINDRPKGVPKGRSRDGNGIGDGIGDDIGDDIGGQRMGRSSR